MEVAVSQRDKQQRGPGVPESARQPCKVSRGVRALIVGWI